MNKEILNQMKELILRSKKEHVEYGATISQNTLINIIKGTEFHVYIKEKVPYFHTHAHNIPEASNADILEMVEAERPFICVGSISRFEHRITISCYKIKDEDRKMLVTIIKKISVYNDKTVKDLQKLNIKIPLNITTYQFYRKWLTSNKTLLWSLGYTTPGVSM